MKIKYCVLYLFPFVLASCVDDLVPESDIETETLTRVGEKEERVFYYYGYENRKIYLNQRKDKVLVKFAPTATKEQFRSVVNSNASLRSKDLDPEKNFVEGYHSNTAILDDQSITSDVLITLRARKEIASATYLLESYGSLTGITDKFIVKLKHGTSYDQLQELADKINCRVGEADEFVENQYNLYVSKTSELDAMQAANLFYETGLFEFAEPNLIDINANNSNDQYFQYQWGLKSPSQNGINIEPAWAITKGSANVRIAVIDSGIDLTHPDLQGNLLAGYDATGYNTGGAPYSTGDNHGTAVAGIIAALQNNIGISGVAPNCKIVPVKASINDSFDRSHSSAAINWVADNYKAEIINCSFGSQNPPTSNLTNAISNAISKGCVVVCSSGNNGLNNVGYPADSNPNILAVGAIDSNGSKASYSNYGMELDVVAPGTNVYTTDRQGSLGYTLDNYDSGFGGTSAAAPHVSGLAALILSVYPDYTRREVEQAIIQSTADYPIRYNTVGYGLVDAYKAIVGQMAPTGPRSVAQNSPYPAEYYVPVPPVGATFNGWTISSSGGYLRHIVTSNRNLSTTFTAAGTYSVTAHYTMPNNSPLDLTLRNIAVTSPTAVAPQILTPQGTDWYPWSGDVTFDVFPRLSGGVRYEWDCTELYMLFNPDPTVGAPRIVNPASSSYVDGQQLTARVRVVVGSYPNYTYSPWSNWATITLHD